MCECRKLLIIIGVSILVGVIIPELYYYFSGHDDEWH